MKRRLLGIAAISAASLLFVVTAQADVRQKVEPTASTETSTTLSALRHHHRHYGLICGATQKAYFGKGSNLSLAWADDFPHSDAHPGAVVVQRRNGMDSSGKHRGGHVSRIIRNTTPCHAIVADEKGQYERDICKNLVAYVDPNANPVSLFGQATQPRIQRVVRHRMRHHRYAHRTHLATR